MTAIFENYDTDDTWEWIDASIMLVKTMYMNAVHEILGAVAWYAYKVF